MYFFFPYALVPIYGVVPLQNFITLLLMVYLHNFFIIVKLSKFTTFFLLYFGSLMSHKKTLAFQNECLHFFEKKMVIFCMMFIIFFFFYSVPNAYFTKVLVSLKRKMYDLSFLHVYYSSTFYGKVLKFELEMGLLFFFINTHFFFFQLL